MVSITNALSSSLLSNLNKTEKKQSQELKTLAQGEKTTDITKTVVSLISSEQLDAAISGLDAAEKNLDQAAGLLDVAAGGMEGQLAYLQELNSLAVQAADDTLSASERQSLAAQADSLLAGMSDLAESLDFNGTKLLDGSFGSSGVQSGASAGDTVEFEIDSATAASLGVDDTDFSSAASAGASLTNIQGAITLISASLSEVGAASNRLESAQTTNAATKENLTEAQSKEKDADIAESVMKLKALSLKKSLTVTLLDKSTESQSKTMDQIL